MEITKKIFDTLLRLAPGGFYGLASIILAGVFIFLSYTQFPDYDMINNDVSVLGIGPGLSKIFFNIGIFITGFTTIPFFVYLGRVLKQEAEEEKLIKRTVKISIIGCIALSLIGCFPVINIIIGTIHAILALIFFSCSLINLIFFGIAFLKDERFSNIHAYFGFIIACSIAFYIAVRWSIIEWIVFFLLGGWMLMVSSYMLYHKL